VQHFVFKKVTPEQLVFELTCPVTTEQYARRVIAWVEHPGGLWRVVETYARQDIYKGLKAGETRREIVCDIIRRNEDSGGLGVRSIPESEKPTHYSCPLHFLDMTPVYSFEWRASVRRFYEELEAMEALYRELQGITDEAAFVV